MSRLSICVTGMPSEASSAKAKATPALQQFRRTLKLQRR